MTNPDQLIEDASKKSTLAAVMLIAELTAAELKSRLDLHKSVMTIVDIRHPTSFNQEHISGAVSVPLSRLEDLAQSALTHHREIYVYGDSDAQSLDGAKILLDTGFITVAQIIGGIAAWHEIVGSTESIRI
jgi:rhodanese-related sulfurtransferase